MPKISIVSNDGRNEFVTVPDRLNKMDYTDCKVSVSSCPDKYALTDIVAGVKVRGNYTANYNKKPLRIKFEKKQGMLGLNDGLKAKNWVLLADVKDSSLLRNLSAFYLGHKILGSDGYYTSSFCPVRVEINGQYWGVYLLAEQQEAKTGRIEITEPEEGQVDPRIGYFFEFDGYWTEEGPDGDPTFTISHNNNAYLPGPNGGRITHFGNNGYTIKSDILDDSQRVFASKYVENIYEIAYKAAINHQYFDLSEDGTKLVSASGSDPLAHINRYLDVHSLVDTYLIQEITCDPDIGWSSFYLDFDLGAGKDHRLRFEAPWDYDSAIGNKNNACESGKGYYAWGSGNPWLSLLTGQTFFQDMVKAKWAKLVEEDCFNKMYLTLANYTDVYKDYYAENFSRWNHMGGNYPDTAGELREQSRSVTSQRLAFEFTADWYGDRLSYLSTVYGDGRDMHAPIYPELSVPEGYQATRYEAENQSVFGNPKIANDSTASGGKYVGQLDSNLNSGFRFSFDVAEASNAYVAYGLAKQINSRDPQEMFDFRLNGKVIEFPYRYNPAAKNEQNRYHEWGEVLMGEISVPSGNNIIEIRSKGSATNFDYIDLYLPIPSQN